MEQQAAEIAKHCKNQESMHQWIKSNSSKFRSDYEQQHKNDDKPKEQIDGPELIKSPLPVEPTS
jgi:hypothetical protein